MSQLAICYENLKPTCHHTLETLKFKRNSKRIKQNQHKPKFCNKEKNKVEKKSSHEECNPRERINPRTSALERINPSTREHNI
jgi:hypothetical protein